MQNFNDLVQEEHFQICGRIKEEEENVCFQRKIGHISKTVRDTAKVTIHLE